MDELKCLNARKELYNHIVESYIHVLIYENNKQNTICITNKEGCAIFFEGNTFCFSNDNKYVRDNGLVIMPILYKKHYTVIIVNVEKREMVYILVDPLGEDQLLITKHLNTLKRFTDCDTCTAKTLQHDIQKDSVNCVVYVCLFVVHLLKEHD